VSRVILLCGLPGAGKTTVAVRLAEEHGGVRLSPDEWMRALRVDLFDQAMRGRIEQLQWELAQRLAVLGNTVLIEWGTWARAERDEVRRWCRENGVAVELRYLDVPFEVLWDRVSRRNGLPGEAVLERDDLRRWADELFEAPTKDELALFDPPRAAGPP
jgi:predicted kinase